MREKRINVNKNSVLSLILLYVQQLYQNGESIKRKLCHGQTLTKRSLANSDRKFDYSIAPSTLEVYINSYGPSMLQSSPQWFSR